jgi:hypothetical protein
LITLNCSAVSFSGLLGSRQPKPSKPCRGEDEAAAEEATRHLAERCRDGLSALGKAARPEPLCDVTLEETREGVCDCVADHCARDGTDDAEGDAAPDRGKSEQTRIEATKHQIGDSRCDAAIGEQQGNEGDEAEDKDDRPERKGVVEREDTSSADQHYNGNNDCHASNHSRVSDPAA